MITSLAAAGSQVGINKPTAVACQTRRRCSVLTIWFVPGSENSNTSSEPFAEEFSPDENYLYVMNQHTNPDHTINYNYIHTRVVGSDGKLSQPSEPLKINVGAHYRPQGLVIY